MFKMLEYLKRKIKIYNSVSDIVFSYPYTVNICEELDIQLNIKIM